MNKIFNAMSRDARWTESERVAVLMDFINSLTVDGKITNEEFVDFVDIRVMEVRDERELDRKDRIETSRKILKLFPDDNHISEE